jgi:hypothetical protein
MEGSPERAYDTFVSTDLPYATVTLSTGEKVRLDNAAYTKYRAVPNRADRQLVFKTFWGKYKEFERTLGNHARRRGQDASVRHEGAQVQVVPRSRVVRRQHPDHRLHAADRGRAREPADAPPVSQAAQSA